jgi:hypothetical protein
MNVHYVTAKGASSHDANILVQRRLEYARELWAQIRLGVGCS